MDSSPLRDGTDYAAVPTGTPAAEPSTREISAFDTANTRILRERFAWFSRVTRRIDRRHTPYSFVSAMAAFMLLLTLIVDFLFGADAGIPPSIQIALLGLCVAFTTVPLAMGRRYPPWAGLIPIATIAAATLYFIGFSGVRQAGISSMQELPIIALYLGWFYRGWLARCVMIAFSMCVFVAILMSSTFGGAGNFATPIGIAAVAIMVFCFEAGSYLQRELERHALHDHLTGVLNRRGFSERFAIEHERSRRLGTELSLAVIDFDYFKRVNDELGHSAGDELLRSSVRAWSLRLFDGDCLGRLGGDEFVMMLPQRTPRDVRALLELLHAASTHSWSWGTSVVGPEDTLEAVLARADRELYESKGRARQ